jgi:hypothetical protein
MAQQRTGRRKVGKGESIRLIDQNTIVRFDHIADKLGDESVEQLFRSKAWMGHQIFPALILI